MPPEFSRNQGILFGLFAALLAFTSSAALADRCEAPLPNRVGQVFTADSKDSALYIFVSNQRNAQSWPKGNLGLGFLRPAQTSRHWSDSARPRLGSAESLKHTLCRFGRSGEAGEFWSVVVGFCQNNKQLFEQGKIRVVDGRVERLFDPVVARDESWVGVAHFCSTGL